MKVTSLIIGAAMILLFCVAENSLATPSIEIMWGGSGEAYEVVSLDPIPDTTGNFSKYCHWDMDADCTDFHWGGSEVGISTSTNSNIFGIVTWNPAEQRWDFKGGTIEKCEYFTILATGFTTEATHTITPTPEPVTIALLGLGALSLIRRKRSA